MSSPGAAVPAPPGLRAASTCIVVIGAGRSGSSAITRGLQAVGVELGDRLRGATRKNATGFFEDKDLVVLNQRLKRILGIRSQSVALIPPSEWQRPAVRALQDEAVETIRRRFERYPLWGYKYARTLRMFPFWLAVYRVLELDVRYLMAVRNPLSVARSRRQLEDAGRASQEKSDVEWLVNVVPYFREIRDRPFVVVDYDNLMADPVRQLRRIVSTLDLPVTQEIQRGIEVYAQRFLRSGMRHSRFTVEDLERAPEVNVLTRDGYRWLNRLANDEADSSGGSMWQEWERIERGVQDLAPVLRHVDRIEAIARRAERSPFGPLQAVPGVLRKLRRKWPTRGLVAS